MCFEQNLKKRYFQLRLVEAATIRGLILEPRYRPLNNDTHLDDSHNQTKKVYVLECFKEMPSAVAATAASNSSAPSSTALLKQQTPKHRIVFDYNIRELTKSQQTAHAFELSETSIETNKETRHLFAAADSSKSFDDWFTSIEKIIALNQKISRANKTEMMLINEKLLSPISSLNSASASLASASSSVSSSSSAASSSSSAATTTSSSSTSSVSDASSNQSPNQSTSSGRNSNQSSTRNSHFLDDFKLANNNHLNQQQFIENFHLEKVNVLF